MRKVMSNTNKQPTNQPTESILNTDVLMNYSAAKSQRLRDWECGRTHQQQQRSSRETEDSRRMGQKKSQSHWEMDG